MFVAEKSPGPASRHQRSRGSGRISVSKRDDHTTIQTLYQQGCAKLRVPASRDGNLQAIMINSSGGMTGGDRLDWRFKCGPNTNLTVTTQACERIYKSSEGPAQTDVSISMGDGARLAWLPQETILYDGGRYCRLIEADLYGEAEVLLVEPLIFGRRTMGEIVKTGSLRDRWRIRRDDRLLHAEEFLIGEPVSDLLAKRAVTGGHTAMATVLLISPAAEGLLPAVRQLIGKAGAASFWNGKLLARLIAADGYELRKTLTPLIGLLNGGAALPKVWTF